MNNSSWLPVIRELMAGILAVTVMIVFYVLVGRAMSSLPSGAAAADFQPIKDLLAIINPVVGLIIGYYFSRATSEARAERAEAAAATANDTANKTQEAANSAEREKTHTAADAAKAKSALLSLVGAVEGSKIVTDGEHASGSAKAQEALTRLQLAVERAKHVLG